MLGDNAKDLQEYLDVFVIESRKVGLSININKTKSMVFGDKCNTTASFTIDNTELEEVDTFVYIGYNVDKSRNDEKALIRRISLAMATFKKKVSYSPLKEFQSS